MKNLVLKTTAIFTFVCFLFFQSVCLAKETEYEDDYLYAIAENGDGTEDYIKWVDFNIPLEVLQKAMALDIASYNSQTPLNWVELLAYGSAKNWGNMGNPKKVTADIQAAAKKLGEGMKISELTEGMKLYDYYYKAYSAVLGGFVGEYEQLTNDEAGNEVLEKKYGLKVFSPVAKGYSFGHYDDFGDGRSYGYKRKHQGNDLLGSVGTPIVAVEDGYVEALGWNRFGGWRVGIRSFDKKRYYYYAHLRKDKPYHSKLYEGMTVKAGDVIGYLGMSGYSANENVNNIKIPHLHFGLQLIFDESQKDGVNQIWIDLYNIVELLNKNKMPVKKVDADFEPARAVNSIPID